MVEVSSPGKLMIAGEWSVLEPGSQCVVASVERRVHVSVEASDRFMVDMPDLGIAFEAVMENGRLSINTGMGEEGYEKARFASAAIETSLQYLAENGRKTGPLKIRIWKDPAQNDILKTGFGYFASVIVSVVAGILSESGIDVSKSRDIIFKLSSVAYYRTPGRGGSSYNIAAAVHGGTFVYRRFDGEWLKNEMDDIDSGNQKLSQLVTKNWPGYYFKPAAFPESMHVCTGIIGEPVSAHSVVRQMMNFKRHSAAEYDRMMRELRGSVDYFIISLSNKDCPGMIETLRKNQALLSELGERSGIEMGTPKLRRLCWIAARHGGIGKISGAGKSDIGIAICFDSSDAEKIIQEWKINGIEPVDAKIAMDGVVVGK